jgi:hypothetical protein
MFSKVRGDNMHTLIRSFLLVLAAALVLLFAVACNSGDGGTGGDDQTRFGEPAGQTDGQTVADDGPDGSSDDSVADDGSDASSDDFVSDDGSGDLVSAAPLEVLSESAESFQDEVESLQVEMVFSASAGGFEIDLTANMAFQAPDKMHMTMDMPELGSFEMLMLGSDIYMEIPEQGWVVFSMEDVLDGMGSGGLGVDSESLQDAFDDHSFVDYEEIVGSLGGDVEDLGEETVDGGVYRHYRASLDLSDLSAAFGDAFSVTEDLNLEDISGPMTFDIWVDADTFLPYKFAMEGEFTFDGEVMVLEATMLFTGYNEPVDIPAAPEDAVSFAELFSGLFEGLE